MDNTDSSPAILFPTIPADTCFTGNSASQFQQLISQFLSNATIDVPGLGLVTPAEIIAINAELVSQQNQIDALNKAAQTGTGALGTGDQTVVVNFGSPMPSTNYRITITPVGTAATLTVFTWALISGTQATTGFSLQWQDVPATVNSFIWDVQAR